MDHWQTLIHFTPDSHISGQGDGQQTAISVTCDLRLTKAQIHSYAQIYSKLQPAEMKTTMPSDALKGPRSNFVKALFEMLRAHLRPSRPVL